MDGKRRTLAECLARAREIGSEAFAAEWSAPVLLFRFLAPAGAVANTTRASGGALQPDLVLHGDERDLDVTVVPVVQRASNPQASTITLGRSTVTDLELPNPQISVMHAHFKVTGSEYWLADSGSRNGTHVDGRRLAEGEAVRITDGQTFRLGEASFTFRAAEAFHRLVQDLGGRD